MKTVSIQGETIELAKFLKFAGLVETGGHAKVAITSGLVKVNGTVAGQRALKLRAGDRVEFEGVTLEINSSV